jgi:NAD(P)-dependent dehydrogenase (short-subunit alcohol dehydrogenase family)
MTLSDGSGSVVVVGGTRAIGFEIVRHYAARGYEVVLCGQTPESVDSAVARAREGTDGNVTGAVFDLAEPHGIAAALAGIGQVRHLVLAAIDRDANTVADYSIDRAIRLVTLKLVGYTEVVHTLLDRLSEDASLVLFGGLAKERPYPGSTTVTTVNGGVVGLTRTLVEELKPRRVNSIHPGIVGDSPYWVDKQAATDKARSETPIGRLATMDDIVNAVSFLLENQSVNGVELFVDGGWHTR